jgi:hypothetical protein
LYSKQLSCRVRTSVERNRFDVPLAESGLALGTLVVIRKASGDSATAADPLRISSVSIAPEVGSGELPIGTQEVPLFLPIYPSLSPARAELHFEVLHGGETVARSTPQLPPVGPDGRVAWIGSLPTKGLAPGRYEVVPPCAVLEYEQSFQNIAADETYTQRVTVHNSRDRVASRGMTPIKRVVTKADVVSARLAGAVPWGCFRDVYEVNGRKVRDSDRRLETLFASIPLMSAAQRATALLAESARYNVGPAVRNIDFPTLALAFLHPMKQGRFAWSVGGRRRFGPVEGLEVQQRPLARAGSAGSPSARRRKRTSRPRNPSRAEASTRTPQKRKRRHSDPRSSDGA